MPQSANPKGQRRQHSSRYVLKYEDPGSCVHPAFDSLVDYLAPIAAERLVALPEIAEARGAYRINHTQQAKSLITIVRGQSSFASGH